MEENITSVETTPNTDGRSYSKRESLFGIIAVFVWLGLWEIIARGSPRFFSPPSQFLSLLFEAFLAGELWPHFWLTLRRFMVGMLVGIPPGILLGRIVSRNEACKLRCSPLIFMLCMIPVFSLLPTHILLFGIGELYKWMVVGWAVFFPAFYSTKTALRFQKRQPNDSAWIFVVLKQCSIVGMLAALLSEMYASTAGLGFLTVVSGATHDTPRVFVAMAATALIMYLFWLAVSIAEAYTARRKDQKCVAI